MILLMALQSPLQSWGCAARYSIRTTHNAPTKSGVIGLLCAALGWGRQADLSPLNRLRMGARIDQEGRLVVDFQVARDVLTANRARRRNDIKRVHYLADAAFLVGLQGDDADLLQRCEHALWNPAWPIYLGRRSCIPARPVCEGLVDSNDLMQTLANYKPLIDPAPKQYGLQIEDDDGPEIIYDVPLSFEEREFAERRYRVMYVSPSSGGELCISPS
jgi:CRISPR system Cascade subunit CasD